MNTHQFTLRDLFHHLIKYSWVTILCVVVGAGGMYVYAKHVSSAPTTYSASRDVFVGKIDTANLSYSSFKAKRAMLDSYVALANDNAIVTATRKQLLKQGLRLTKSDISDHIAISIVNRTLFIRFAATMHSERAALALANQYPKVFAAEGSKILPSMPKIFLMSKAAHATIQNSQAGSVHKKSLFFGASFGLTIGILLSIAIGVYGNLKKISHAE